MACPNMVAMELFVLMASDYHPICTTAKFTQPYYPIVHRFGHFQRYFGAFRPGPTPLPPLWELT